MDNLAEILPITPDELAQYDAESVDGIVYVIRLDKKRFIDVLDRHGSWLFSSVRTKL